MERPMAEAIPTPRYPVELHAWTGRMFRLTADIKRCFPGRGNNSAMADRRIVADSGVRGYASGGSARLTTRGKR